MRLVCAEPVAAGTVSFTSYLTGVEASVVSHGVLGGVDLSNVVGGEVGVVS